MKQLLILCLLFSLHFAEDTISQSIFKNEVTSSNEYINAKVSYKLKDYEKSYTQFDALFKKNPQNELINFYLAMSALKIKKFDLSVAAFERVLIINPEFHRARLEMALILYKLGLKEEAREHFRIVALKPIPKEVRDNINKYLKNDKHNLLASFVFALNYDDNITNGVDGGSFYIANNVGPFTNEEEKSDYSHSEIADIKYNLEITDNINFLNTFVALNKSQIYEKDYAMTLLSYRPTLSFLDKNIKRSVLFAIDKITTGDENNFTSLLFGYSYEKYQSKAFKYAYKFLVQDIMYEREKNNEKDYSKYQANALVQYYYFVYNISLDYDAKTRGTRKDIDKIILSNSLALNYKIYRELFLLKYTYKTSFYNDENKNFKTKREDTYNKLQLNIAHYFDQKSSISINLATLTNQSNQDSYDYSKNTISLNYIRSFSW